MGIPFLPCPLSVSSNFDSPIPAVYSTDESFWIALIEASTTIANLCLKTAAVQLAGYWSC